jgi:hypothetical protein
VSATEGRRDKPRVVIVGGGFGGLRAARALRSASVEVTLRDRRNYHLFQPLLYQVATGSLAPAEIAAPLRRIFSKQKNTQVLMGDVRDVDPAAKRPDLAWPPLSPSEWQIAPPVPPRRPGKMSSISNMATASPSTSRLSLPRSAKCWCGTTRRETGNSTGGRRRG